MPPRPSRSPTWYRSHRTVSRSAPGGVLPVTDLLYPASTAAIRPGPLELDADHASLLPLHGGAIVVPIGVLARHPPVVVDQEVHGVGQVDDLGAAVDLDPLAVELVAHHAHRHGLIAPHVLDLHGRLTGRDDGPPVLVHRHGDGRELRATVSAVGRQHG